MRALSLLIMCGKVIVGCVFADVRLLRYLLVSPTLAKFLGHGDPTGEPTSWPLSGQGPPILSGNEWPVCPAYGLT